MKVLVALFLGSLFMLSGCGSKEVKSAIPEAVMPKKETIDWQGKSFGRPLNETAAIASEGNIGELSKMEQFRGKQVFLATQQGQNLDALRLWAQRFSIQADVVGMFERFINDRTRADQSGNAQTTAVMGDVRAALNSVAQGRVVGLQKELDYWILERTYDPITSTIKDQYTYIVVYAIDRELLMRQIGNALDGVKAKHPDQQKLIDESTEDLRKFMETNR
jgi:hypothetical protein